MPAESAAPRPQTVLMMVVAAWLAGIVAVVAVAVAAQPAASLPCTVLMVVFVVVAGCWAHTVQMVAAPAEPGGPPPCTALPMVIAWWLAGAEG